MSAAEIERQIAEEIARGQWPTWPFARLTPEQVRQFERAQREDRRREIDDFEPAPF